MRDLQTVNHFETRYYCRTRATLDFDDLQSVKVYGNKSLGEWRPFGGPGFKVYSRSKLCNILFSRAAFRRRARVSPQFR